MGARARTGRRWLAPAWPTERQGWEAFPFTVHAVIRSKQWISPRYRRGTHALVRSDLFAADPAIVRQRPVYFDTPGQDLSAAGFAPDTRSRRKARSDGEDGVGTGATGLFVRPEWEQALEMTFRFWTTRRGSAIYRLRAVSVARHQHPRRTGCCSRPVRSGSDRRTTVVYPMPTPRVIHAEGPRGTPTEMKQIPPRARPTFVDFPRVRPRWS